MEDDNTPKKRRNLILSGLAIIAVKENLVTIEKNIKLFNGTLTVNDQIFVLWLPILFLYCYWRYWNSVSPKESLGLFSRNSCKTLVQRKVLRYAKKVCSIILEKPEGEIHPNFSSSTDTTATIDTGPYQYSFPTAQQRALLRDFKVKWNRVGNDNAAQFSLTLSPSNIKMTYFWAVAIVRSVFEDASFSEYIFPHVIAVITILELSREKLHSLSNALDIFFGPLWVC